MTTTLNSSSESVVSLSYSEVISFEEVKGEVVEEIKESTNEEAELYEAEELYEESTDGSTDENIEEVFEAYEIHEIHEDHEEHETHEPYETCEASLSDTLISDSASTSSDTTIPTIKEIIHFPSPAPAPLQSGTTSATSVNSSWTDTIEAFLDQLNDIDFDSDYERDILLKRGLASEYNQTEEEEEEEEEAKVINELRTGQGFLLCLAVPVLLSQILMLLILSSTTSNAKSSIIVRPIGHIQTIHYHHHHHYHEDRKPSNTGFAYVLFNPFGAIYNSRYFKTTAAWISKEYHKQLNNPSSLISQLSRYTALYLNNIKSRVFKLKDVMRSGLDNEIGKALRVRDNWNRVVYDKIYKIASTPQYQRVVSTVSKWASAIKEHLFPSN